MQWKLCNETYQTIPGFANSSRKCPEVSTVYCVYCSKYSSSFCYMVSTTWFPQINMGFLSVLSRKFSCSLYEPCLNKNFRATISLKWMHVYVILTARSWDFFPCAAFPHELKKKHFYYVLNCKANSCQKGITELKKDIQMQEKFMVSTVNNANTLHLGKMTSPGVFCWLKYILNIQYF